MFDITLAVASFVEVINRVATHLETLGNLDKSGNLRVVSEN